MMDPEDTRLGGAHCELERPLTLADKVHICKNFKFTNKFLFSMDKLFMRYGKPSLHGGLAINS